MFTFIMWCAICLFFLRRVMDMIGDMVRVFDRSDSGGEFAGAMIGLLLGHGIDWIFAIFAIRYIFNSVI